MHQAGVGDPGAMKVKLPEIRREADELGQVCIGEAIAREEAIHQLDLVPAMGYDDVTADHEILSLFDGDNAEVVLDPEDVGAQGPSFSAL